MTADSPRAPACEEAVRARIAVARLWAAHQAPYLASAVFALNPVILEPALDEDTGVPVADPEFRAFPADTRWNLYVEPGTALATPVEEVGWWMLHQVGHLVRGHAARSPVRPEPGHEVSHAAGVVRDGEAHRWNQAADAEITGSPSSTGNCSNAPSRPASRIGSARAARCRQAGAAGPRSACAPR